MNRVLQTGPHFDASFFAVTVPTSEQKFIPQVALLFAAIGTLPPTLFQVLKPPMLGITSNCKAWNPHW
jgi:hypothetical protein